MEFRQDQPGASSPLKAPATEAAPQVGPCCSHQPDQAGWDTATRCEAAAAVKPPRAQPCKQTVPTGQTSRGISAGSPVSLPPPHHPLPRPPRPPEWWEEMSFVPGRFGMLEAAVKLAWWGHRAIILQGCVRRELLPAAEAAAAQLWPTKVIHCHCSRGNFRGSRGHLSLRMHVVPAWIHFARCAQGR